MQYPTLSMSLLSPLSQLLPNLPSFTASFLHLDGARFENVYILF